MNNQQQNLSKNGGNDQETIQSSTTPYTLYEG